MSKKRNWGGGDSQSHRLGLINQKIVVEKNAETRMIFRISLFYKYDILSLIHSDVVNLHGSHAIFPGPLPLTLLVVKTVLGLAPAHAIAPRLVRPSTLVCEAIGNETIFTSNSHIQEQVELK